MVVTPALLRKGSCWGEWGRTLFQVSGKPGAAILTAHSQTGGSHPAQQADEEQAQNQVPHAGCMALGRQRVGGEGAVSPTKIDRPRGWGVEIRGKEHPAKDVEH